MKAKLLQPKTECLLNEFTGKAVFIKTMQLKEKNISKRLGANGILRTGLNFISRGEEAGYDIRIVQELLGHEDVETTQIYTHVLAKRLQSVRSPADMFGKNGFMKSSIALGELPPALEKRFRDVVQNHYQGDIQAALTAFLDLYDKHVAATQQSGGRTKNV